MWTLQLRFVCILVLFVGLNILDSFLTMMILMEGVRRQIHVRSVIQLHGDRFWIWKFGLLSCFV
jgi:hypothetical protein